MSEAFRKTLLSIHRWVGLTVGFSLLLFAVTGGVLVLREHFEERLQSDLFEVPRCDAPISLDDLAVIAQGVFPGERLSQVDLTTNPQHSIAFQYPNKDYVYINPCDSSVLGIQNEYGGFFGTLDGLHRFRFLESDWPIAGALNLVAGVAIVIFGLAVWWPRSRASIRPALTYNRKLPGIARTLSLHRVVGICGSFLLLFMIVTAIPFSFDWGKDLIKVATGTPTTSPAYPELTEHRTSEISLQRAWETARKSMPTLYWASIRYPRTPTEPIRVETLEESAPHNEANSYLFLDPDSAEVISTAPFETGVSQGRKVYLYILALHAGLVGGIVFQLALCIGCFAVLVQAYSGMWPWLKRKIKPRSKAKLKLKVIAKYEETPDIFVFRLADARGGKLPAFNAGSHIDVELPSGLVRQYSLCNDPQQTDHYQFAVLLTENSRGGSRELHQCLKEGAEIYVSTPRNHFSLVKESKHSILIAGGIGITPLLSMTGQLASTGSSFQLHYCVRREEDVAFRDRLRHDRFFGRVHFHISESGSRLNLTELISNLESSVHIYTCGPERLMTAVTEAAERAGLPSQNVHREHFVGVAQDMSLNTAFDIKIASTGAVFLVSEDQTVTDVLANNGIDIPMSCSQGICGTCVTRIIEGEIDHRDSIFSDDERQRNDQMTLCCSRAISSRLVIDL